MKLATPLRAPPRAESTIGLELNSDPGDTIRWYESFTLELCFAFPARQPCRPWKQHDWLGGM